MKNFRFWVPSIIGVLVTLFSLYLATLGTDHAGAGLGVMLVFYPLPAFAAMLLAGGPSGDPFLSRIVSVLAVGVAAVQFPFYGFIISYARLKRSFWLKLCASIVWLHISAIIICIFIALTQGWL